MRDKRLSLPAYEGTGDGYAFGCIIARQLIHELHEVLLHNGAQTPCAGVTLQSLLRNGIQRVLIKDQADAVKSEQFSILLDNGVLGIPKNTHQSLLVQIIQCGDDRDTSDKLGDKPELDDVVRLDLRIQTPGRSLGFGFYLAAEADGGAALPLFDNAAQTVKGAPADEQDIFRVDADEFLVWVLASALRRHIGYRPGFSAEPAARLHRIRRA